MKFIPLFFTIIVLVYYTAPALSADDVPFNYVPLNGAVPDEETAIQVGEAILMPIYGKNLIKGEEPFHAKLHEDVWTVMGSVPEGMVGGAAIIDISKSKGCVTRILHQQ